MPPGSCQAENPVLVYPPTPYVHAPDESNMPFALEPSVVFFHCSIYVLCLQQNHYVMSLLSTRLCVHYTTLA